MVTTAKWAMKLFPHGGYYVEAGAHDGVGDSQTLELEKAGWKGLCIEPSSAYYGLTLSRKCETDNRCLYSYNGSVLFQEVAGNAELSGIPMRFSGKYDRPSLYKKLVTCVTLESMLFEHKSPKVFELLVLDIEGAETDIIWNHDFSAYKPLAAIIEHNGETWRKESLYITMNNNGYKLKIDDGTNSWYLHVDYTKLRKNG